MVRFQGSTSFLGRAPATTSDGSRYVTDDDGRSILFYNTNNNRLSTALTREELAKYLKLSEVDPKSRNFLSQSFEINSHVDEAQVAAMAMEVANDRLVIESLKALPEIFLAKTEPSFSDYRTRCVIQGDGETVNAAEFDFIGTNGMGPCVAVIIFQGPKCFVAHIDSFKQPGLGGKSGKEILDRNIQNFDLKAPLKIALLGANDGGRETVLHIAKYFQELQLFDHIEGANVLGKGNSSSVVVSVKDHSVFPGRKIPGF
jgi:hypothetical protein